MSKNSSDVNEINLAIDKIIDATENLNKAYMEFIEKARPLDSKEDEQCIWLLTAKAEFRETKKAVTQTRKRPRAEEVKVFEELISRRKKINK